MQRVIHHSLLITLEITPAGVGKCTTQQTTADLVGVWLHTVGQHVVRRIPSPNLEIYVRQLPIASGAHIQILLCWIALQAQYRQFEDFDERI